MVEGVLVFDDIVPSDGGLYSCMAVSSSGNASRDVAIHSKTTVLEINILIECVCPTAGVYDVLLLKTSPKPDPLTPQPSLVHLSTCQSHPDPLRSSSTSKHYLSTEEHPSQVLSCSGSKPLQNNGKR